MPNIRMSRIDGEIQKAVAKIIDTKFHSKELVGAMITVQRVDTTPDLLQSTIYITTLGVNSLVAVNALEKGKNFIRRELAQAIRLRTIPDLTFKYDDSIDYANHMNELFDQIKTNPDHQ